MCELRFGKDLEAVNNAVFSVTFRDLVGERLKSTTKIAVTVIDPRTDV